MNWGIRMTDKHMDDLLNDLFAEAKTDQSATPSDDFMARMLAQAEAHQPEPAPLAAPVAPEKSRGFLAGLFDMVGGWQGASGLAAATVASVVIGFNGADALTIDGLQTIIAGDADYYLSDLSGDFSFEFDEG